MSTHEYACQVSWRGSTGAGYDAYDRTHRVSFGGLQVRAGAVLTLSSDQAFRGDPTLLNPEQLLLAAAASCQLLSFLAVAARARLDVTSYDDHASAAMPEDDPPVRVTAIELRPRVVVAATRADGVAVTAERVKHLLEVAHRECFIANSLTASISVVGEVELLTPRG